MSGVNLSKLDTSKFEALLKSDSAAELHQGATELLLAAFEQASELVDAGVEVPPEPLSFFINLANFLETRAVYVGQYGNTFDESLVNSEDEG